MLDADPAQDARRFADVRCTIRAGGSFTRGRHHPVPSN
jgi:hypothetical protein